MMAEFIYLKKVVLYLVVVGFCLIWSAAVFYCYRLFDISQY